MRVALVHDWLTGMRGGERCLEAFCELFPDATIFTLVHVPGTVSEPIESSRIRVSPLNRVPGISRHYRMFLPLFPFMAERFNLRGYDLVLSSSHCVAKGVRAPREALHVSYIYTPMRYVWDLYDDYFGPGQASVWRRGLMAMLRPRLQRWDARTAARVHHFVAISRHVADRVQRHYGREASVIYPPVDAARFHVRPGAGQFYLVVSAFAPYKRIDLAIQACNMLRRPLKIVGGGQDEKKLRALAGPTVEFLGPRSDEDVAALYADCRALLFPGVEDFGITPLEAMASGRPVVAFAQGGALETILPLETPAGERCGVAGDRSRCGAVESAPTGVFFESQTAESLAAAIERFEANDARFEPEALRDHALRFDREVFKQRFSSFVNARWAEHVAGRGRAVSDQRSAVSDERSASARTRGARGRVT
jgi:glycosyltransferase involved in cell wall biosynthesis